MARKIDSHDVTAWLDENANDFSPPVCNKCMFDGQLTVFFVGGPNQRKDYHIEEGEEFFYQIKGDMVLKVIENSEFKDIVIREGEVFMLPARIQHSPQRFADSVGLVVERRRSDKEMDGIRYFVEGSDQVLYERWFHLKNIVKDLPPLIKEYFQSEAHKTGRPTPDSVILADRPFDADVTTRLARPFSLSKWIDTNRERIIASTSPTKLFGSPDYKTSVYVYGSGSYDIKSSDGETLIIQNIGSCEVTVASEIHRLEPNWMARVVANTQINLVVLENSFTLVLIMPPV